MTKLSPIDFTGTPLDYFSLDSYLWVSTSMMYTHIPSVKDETIFNPSVRINVTYMQKCTVFLHVDRMLHIWWTPCIFEKLGTTEFILQIGNMSGLHYPSIFHQHICPLVLSKLDVMMDWGMWVLDSNSIQTRHSTSQWMIFSLAWLLYRSVEWKLIGHLSGLMCLWTSLRQLYNVN